MLGLARPQFVLHREGQVPKVVETAHGFRRLESRCLQFLLVEIRSRTQILDLLSVDRFILAPLFVWLPNLGLGIKEFRCRHGRLVPVILDGFLAVMGK